MTQSGDDAPEDWPETIREICARSDFALLSDDELNKVRAFLKATGGRRRVSYEKQMEDQRTGNQERDQNARRRLSQIVLFNEAERSEGEKGKKVVTVAKAKGPIFIGHGRSPAWRDLAFLLTERMELSYEEYNRESQAGRTTKERLLELLDKCTFAFLISTGEDDQADGTKRARQNVVHEVGLFQGRYGWERAIVLLEDGCGEFSNITGVGQIRFAKGNVRSAAEEIRQVLEREGYLSRP